MTMPDNLATSPTSPGTATDDLLRNADEFAARRSVTAALPAPPARRVAVVACMDARLDVTALFGLGEGDAHVIRNAGGIVTEDVLRSLAVSQHALGTTEIILLRHTECGMQYITDEIFQEKVESSTGVRPEFPVLGFADLDAAVRDEVTTLSADPILRASKSIRGFVYDVATGRLREIA